MWMEIDALKRISEATVKLTAAVSESTTEKMLLIQLGGKCLEKC